MNKKISVDTDISTESKIKSGPVAQWIAHDPAKIKVVGSNPTGATITYNHLNILI